MKSSRKSALLWVVPLLLAAGAAVWTLRAGRVAAAPGPAATPGGAEDDAHRSAAVAAKLRDVQAIVAARNANVGKDEAAFRADGWTMVSVPPPDQKLIHYNPALLDGRERDLQTQLASTVPSPQEAHDVATIARKAREEKTRYLAVKALGQLNAPESIGELYSLLSDGSLAAGDEARAEIPSLLRPSALDDAQAGPIAKLLDSPALSDVEKKQIAFTLSLIGLRDGMTLDPQILASLSPTARALLDSMRVLAQSSFVHATQRQGGTP